MLRHPIRRRIQLVSTQEETTLELFHVFDADQPDAAFDGGVVSCISFYDRESVSPCVDITPTCAQLTQQRMSGRQQFLANPETFTLTGNY